ncbi:TetR family transcriptional regulator [Frondihabitans australicus]|uniref:TetR family transcriptional regulator n=2 Tax=Frondihabitans australicus TaxID=386892 RepID=A0A495IK95_9MICO|nr:TetR family transcriptional regulator [Frondihabitans australicus]
MSDPVRSRRERPAKPALSRKWIVDSTIQIMRTEGLEKATMRRVAQALDTGPASLYVYVANTTELHAAVLDELLGELPNSASASTAGWRARLEALLHTYAEILFTHPGLARSALVLRPSGPNALALFDAALGLLIEGGIEPARAAWGADVLLQFVTATAAELSAPAPADVIAADEHTRSESLAAAVRSASALTTPHLVANASAVLSGDPTQRFAWTVDALLVGIAVTPTPATHSTAS